MCPKNAGNFISKYDYDNESSCGNNALNSPAGHDQSNAYHHSFQYPENGDSNERPAYFGSPKKDIEPEQDITVQEDIKYVLPAQADKRLYL
jgi:hypothetical protein